METATCDGSRPAARLINAAESETPNPIPIGKQRRIVSAQPTSPRHCRKTAEKLMMEKLLAVVITKRYRPVLKRVSYVDLKEGQY